MMIPNRGHPRINADGFFFSETFLNVSSVATSEQRKNQLEIRSRANFPNRAGGDK
jgi:hypothetical protein